MVLWINTNIIENSEKVKIPSNFNNCTLEELKKLYKLLSSKFEIIKIKKTAQNYPLLRTLLCDDASQELQDFKTIVYEDSVELLKKEILDVLNKRKN